MVGLTTEGAAAGVGDDDFDGDLCRVYLSFLEKMPARIGIVGWGKNESEGRAQVVSLYWPSGISNAVSNVRKERVIVDKSTWRGEGQCRRWEVDEVKVEVETYSEQARDSRSKRFELTTTF